MIITIDAGTTNTRIRLFIDKKMVDERIFKIGVRNNVISGDSNTLSNAIKTNIQKLIDNNGLSKNDLKIIIASGMIGSDLGLMAIDHVQTPVGLTKLANSSKYTFLPQIISAPFLFIPGIKNNTEDLTIDNLYQIDMMRGEEVEVMGIIEILNLTKSFIAVLPGSHSKIIKVNEKLEITDCFTTLGGEIIEAISKNTILKNSLRILFDKFDDDYLIQGCEFCLKYGFNMALFKIRVLDTLIKVNALKVYSFFIGAALANDVKLINNISDSSQIIIGGNRPLKHAISALLKSIYNKECVILSDDQANIATSLGAIKVYKQKIKQNE